jgi:5-methyltetrahydropteroyltriglutamate--homocysteine methyltransferase
MGNRPRQADPSGAGAGARPGAHEPWLEAAQDDATRLAIRDMERAGIDIITDGEIVFSMGDPAPETPETIAARIRAALAYIPPERLIPAPDCGMKYIPRDLAFAKLKALAEGAAIVRRELTGS